MTSSSASFEVRVGNRVWLDGQGWDICELTGEFVRLRSRDSIRTVSFSMLAGMVIDPPVTGVDTVPAGAWEIPAVVLAGLTRAQQAQLSVEFGCPGRIDAADGPPVKVWSPLGSQAVVPFDGELGAGEFEGRRVTVLEPDQPASFRNEMQGRNLDWIQQELKTVAAKRPDLTHNAGPIGCDGE